MAAARRGRARRPALAGGGAHRRHPDGGTAGGGRSSRPTSWSPPRSRCSSCSRRSRGGGPAPRAHGDRRRDPRPVRRQARRPPGAVAGTAASTWSATTGGSCSGSGCRPRCGRWRWPAGCWWVTGPLPAADRRQRAARPGPADRGAGGRAGRGVHQRAVGRRSTTGWRRWPAAHRSTIVFVNTRRLVERVAMHLGERLGAEAVAAHHGSLSRARRFQAEQRLKARRAEGDRGHRLAGAGHRRRRGRPGAA